MTMAPNTSGILVGVDGSEFSPHRGTVGGA